MLPTLVDDVASRDGWAFEPKWDGWRCLAILDQETVDLRSRRAVDLAPWFPELTRPPATLEGRRAVLDGEIVVLRDGRPDFDAISGRLAARRLAFGPLIFDRPASSPSTCWSWTAKRWQTSPMQRGGMRSSASSSTNRDGRRQWPTLTARPCGRPPATSAWRVSSPKTPAQSGFPAGVAGG